MKKYGLVIGLLSFIIISCNSDDQENAPILGSWKASKVKIISGYNGIILLENQSECITGTTYTFRANGSFEYRQSCSSSYTYESGTFKYNNDSKVIDLYINDEGDTQQSSDTLHSLTEAEMQIINGKSDYDNDGVLDISVIVFIKQ